MNRWRVRGRTTFSGPAHINHFTRLAPSRSYYVGRKLWLLCGDKGWYLRLCRARDNFLQARRTLRVSHAMQTVNQPPFSFSHVDQAHALYNQNKATWSESSIFLVRLYAHHFAKAFPVQNCISEDRTLVQLTPEPSKEIEKRFELSEASALNV